jgi:hypothetical protein
MTITIHLPKEALLKLAYAEAEKQGISLKATGLRLRTVWPYWSGCDSWEERQEAMANGCDLDAVEITFTSAPAPETT